MKAFRIGYTITASFVMILAGLLFVQGFIAPPKAPKMPEYPKYPEYPSDYNSGSSGLMGTLQDAFLKNSSRTNQDVNIPIDEIEPSPVAAIEISPAPETIAAPIYYYPTPTPDAASQEYERKVEEYNQNMKKYSTEYTKYEEEQKKYTKEKMVPYIRNVLVVLVVMLVVSQTLGVILAKKGFELAGGAFSFSGIFAVILSPFVVLGFVVSSAMSSLSQNFNPAQTEAVSFDPIIKTLAIVCMISSLILIVIGALYDKNISLPSIKRQPPQS